MRRFLAPANVALAVLGVITVVLLVLAIQKQNSPSTAPAILGTASTTASAQVPLSVAFSGDGWTSGMPAGGLGPANYTAILAAREGWRVTNPPVFGSGHIAGQPLNGQVSKVVDARPQLVVVSGGRADSEEDPTAIGAATRPLYQDLETRLPQARIVVIGPMWIGDSASTSMREVRDVIRDSAVGANVPFVDLIEAQWFDDRDRDDITLAERH